MQSTLRLCSARAHTPLIKFMGKRSWPSGHAEQHVHPFAPQEIKQQFSDFLKRFQQSETGASVGGSSEAVFENFWQAPERFWKPKSRELSELEIEKVLSGGSS